MKELPPELEDGLEVNVTFRVKIPPAVFKNVEDIAFLTNRNPLDVVVDIFRASELVKPESLFKMVEKGICEELSASPGLRHAFAKLREVT